MRAGRWEGQRQVAGAPEPSPPRVMPHRPQLPHTLAGFLSTFPHPCLPGRFREERGRSGRAGNEGRRTPAAFPSMWGSLGKRGPLVPGNDSNS